MSKQLFNNLVKLGNNNPELREDIKPVLHHLKDREAKKAGIMMDYTAQDCLKAAANRFKGSKSEFLSEAKKYWDMEN